MKTTNKHLFDDFIQAQNTVYPSVIKELTEGRKRSHWMCFIFPQVMLVLPQRTSAYS